MKLIKPELSLKVISSVTALPPVEPLTNSDILGLHSSTKFLPSLVRKKLGDRILKKYGFSKRYMIRTPGETPETLKEEMTGEELATLAVEKCFKDSSKDIGLFVHGTTTSSRYTGSQATAVLSQINQTPAAIEMKAGCSTSLASLYMGVMNLVAGHDNVMINCVETMSKVVNPSIRETWFGLGDGASALWLEKVSEQDAEFKVKGMVFGTNGKFVDMYTTQGKLPPNRNDFENEGYVLAGDGSMLEELAFEHYSKMFHLFEEEFDLSKVKYLIPHQVNQSLVKKVMDRVFKISDLEVITNSQEIGNIGGSSVLYTFCDSLEKQIFQKGDQFLMMSVGGGLSYCMQLWERV